MLRTLWILSGVLAAAAVLTGCPKKIPQPEIDAAEVAMADIENTKDCAPETYQAAKTLMDHARALLKEERYDEAKTKLLAAKQMAEKAKKECEEKKKAEALKKAETPPPAPVAREVEIEPAGGPVQMVTVYFGFNEHTLTDEAREALTNNAEYIRNKTTLRIQIEGHCDNRGSTEYNLALGERRALSVKKYLVKLGVDPSRLEIISYGEERPSDSGQTEEAFSLNRRAEFVEMN